MTDEPKQDPRSRMRAVLGESNEQKKGSPLERLPKRPGTPPPAPAEVDVSPEATETKPGDQTPPKPAGRTKGIRFNLGPVFWTVTGILSLIVNVILIAILGIVLINLRTLNVPGLISMPKDLVGGLYANFEKMDRAHIRTNIVVNADIPVKFDLALNQQTTVVLSQDVRIDNARVTVNTGGLNISNAVTSIVLPAGTNLPIVLNLTVPVDKTVPVTLNVPVDITLHNTDLGEPFQGLQDVVRPVYCLITPDALDLDGHAVCSVQ